MNQEPSSTTENQNQTDQDQDSANNSTAINNPEVNPGKRRRIVTLVVLGLVFSLTAVGFLIWFNNNKNKTSDDQAAVQELQTNDSEQKKSWMIVTQDKVYRVDYDGSSAEVLFDGEKLFDGASPNGEYLSNAADFGIEIARSSDPSKKTLIFQKPEAAEHVDYHWYQDSSALVVSSFTITNKPESSDIQYLPHIKQKFYSIKPDGSDQKLIFEHEEVYGSAEILNVDSENNHLYWRIGGEGGMRTWLNVSELDTGKLITRVDDRIEAMSNEFGKPAQQILDATGHSDKIFALVSSYTDGQIVLLTDVVSSEYKPIPLNNPILQPTGDVVEDECAAGISATNLYYKYDGDYPIVNFINNKTHETELTMYSSKPFTLYSEKTLRTLQPLASDLQNILIAKGSTYSCNAKNEDINNLEFMIYSLDSNVKPVEIPSLTGSKADEFFVEFAGLVNL